MPKDPSEETTTERPETTEAPKPTQPTQPAGGDVEINVNEPGSGDTNNDG